MDSRVLVVVVALAVTPAAAQTVTDGDTHQARWHVLAAVGHRRALADQSLN